MRYMKALMTLIGFLAEVAVSREAKTALGSRHHDRVKGMFPLEG